MQTDEILSISVISNVTLNKLDVKYTKRQQETFSDSRNEQYVTFGMVKLRWHKVDKAKSYAEDFYVVDRAASFAVLGKTANRA